MSSMISWRQSRPRNPQKRGYKMFLFFGSHPLFTDPSMSFFRADFLYSLSKENHFLFHKLTAVLIHHTRKECQQCEMFHNQVMRKGRASTRGWGGHVKHGGRGGVEEVCRSCGIRCGMWMDGGAGVIEGAGRGWVGVEEILKYTRWRHRPRNLPHTHHTHTRPILTVSHLVYPQVSTSASSRPR